MPASDFQKRIQYRGDLKAVFLRVCRDYDIGSYSDHEVIPVGYEDLNLILTTDTGKYFIKIFADFRSEQNCQRYVDIMRRAIEAGVQHPTIYTSQQGYLYETVIDSVPVRLCVLQFVEGKSFYSLQQQPTNEELRVLAYQATLINQMEVKIDPVYDSWAAVNFVAEFDKKRQYLDKGDFALVAPLVEKFRKITLDTLPHCFVHGDIINTNVIRSTDGKLYILDFSVANHYPRVQELAVMCCGLVFNKQEPNSFRGSYELVLSEYQKYLKLTEEEIKLLPLYVQVANAMFIICANYEREVNGNNSIENGSWLELGRAALANSL